MLLKITIILCYSTIRINNYYQIIPLTKRHWVLTPLTQIIIAVGKGLKSLVRPVGHILYKKDPFLTRRF